jgi:hypothetical protein
MASNTEQVTLRKENFERAIRGLTSQMYILKPMVGTTTTDAWKDTFWTEAPGVLTGGTGSGIEGIPRLAGFPELAPEWTRNSAVQVKYGGKGTISEEDANTDFIDAQKRTMVKVAEAIVSSVDGRIYIDLSAAATQTAAAVANWDDSVIANRDPLLDVLIGIEVLKIANVSTTGMTVLQNPHDNTYWITNPKVLANNTLKDTFKVVVTNSVALDECLIYVDGASTWKTVKGLSTDVEVTAGIKIVMKAWEYGQLQVHFPKKLYKITNTAA